MVALSLLIAACAPSAREEEPRGTERDQTAGPSTAPPAVDVIRGQISISSLTTGGIERSASDVHETASISPAADSLVLVWVATFSGAADAPVPSVSGAGLRWDLLVTDPPDPAGRRLSLFVGVGPSPARGRLTLTGMRSGRWAAVQILDETRSGRVGVIDVALMTRHGFETSKILEVEADTEEGALVGGFLFGQAEVPLPAPGVELLGYNSGDGKTLATAWSPSSQPLSITWATPAHSRAIAARVAVFASAG